MDALRRITWLVLKRNGLNRDLRRQISSLVASLHFDACTERYRDEHEALRSYYWLQFKAWARTVHRLGCELCALVESPPDPPDMELRLLRCVNEWNGRHVRKGKYRWVYMYRLPVRRVLLK